MHFHFFSENIKNQKGAVAIIVGICLVMFIGFAALSIDLGHLFVARNELQNAADAGALAGARFLYHADGSVNSGANQIAYDAATDNKSEKVPVEVNWEGGNTGDVQRGHYSFTTGDFTPNDSLYATDLHNVSEEDLDNPDDPGGPDALINAVRVVTRREETPVAAFFAGIFGYDGFRPSAKAIAYIGFAGTILPGDLDQPIAICEQSILDENGNYSCNKGRMINSSEDEYSSESGAWTNFTQDPCSTASANTVRDLVCASGNENILQYGSGIGTVNGMQDNVYRDLQDCWLNANSATNDLRGYPTEPWTLTLPVVDCSGSNTCMEVVGMVTVRLLWVKKSGTDPQWKDIPSEMHDVSNNIDWHWNDVNGLSSYEDLKSLSSEERKEVFADFADAFELEIAPGKKVGDLIRSGELSESDIQKTMFFIPDCEPHEPAGKTGGENFGVLAAIPVLVR